MRDLESRPDLRVRSARGRWVLFTTVAGSGMGFLDATVVNVALRRIGVDLGAGTAGLQWILNGYLLALAALILLGGSLGDRFGRRRVYLIGVGWFTVASALCGVAPNVTALIAARVVQGVGAALLTPGSLAILQASFHPDDRARAIGLWSAFGGLATLAGPLLGGWLVDAASWRWIFLLNVPLAAVVLVAGRRHLPETADESASGPLDVAGAVLGALALAGVTEALVAAPSQGWTAPLPLASAAIGVAAAAGFVTAERSRPHAMLPLGLFSSRQFRAANLTTLALYAALGGQLFLLAVYLQTSLGYSPLESGTAMIPVTLCMLLGSGRAGALAQRIGPRVPMTVGPAIVAAGLVLMTRIRPGTHYAATVLPAALVFGVGLACTVAPLTAAVLAAVEDRHAGVASGVNNAVARAAQLLAVAVLPAVAGIAGAGYRDPALLARGFRRAALVTASLSLAAALASWRGISGKPRSPS